MRSMTNEVNDKNETKKKWDQERRDGQKGDEGKKEIRSHFGSSFIIGKHFWLWRFPAMKTLLFGFAALFLPSCGSAGSANPVNKVVQLLADLEAKIKAEGVEAHRVHEEFAAWCKTQSSDLALAAWSFKWVSSDQDWRSRGQCRDNGGRLEGRCRNSCKGTCGLRRVAKGIVGRDRHVGEGRSPSSNRRWKDHRRWCNNTGLAASSRLSV